MPFLAAINAGFVTSRVILPGDGSSGSESVWYGDRGIVAAGQSSGSNVIQYYNITTTGNAVDFGDLNYSPTRAAGLSNGTRAVIGGGFNGGSTYYNTMDYITVATTGNAQDLGDLSQARSSLAGASDATTGIFAGGALLGTSFELDTIDSFTIATTGNASDFGNLTVGRSLIAGWNNATRAVFAGGDPSGATQSNVIDYITIASAGNAIDFGDMTDSWNRAAGAGDATYALFAAGRRAGSSNANGWTENIDYVTVSTTGNATDFGDLTTFKDNMAGNSNGTRATFSGGSTNTGSNVTLNNIDYVTVATPGNATDFGDLLAVNESATGTSGSPTSGGGGSAQWYGDRGIVFGGSGTNTIQYFDITSSSNAASFGTLSANTERGAACSNGSRVVAMSMPASNRDRMEYIASATLGNGTLFGNLVDTMDYTGAVSDGTYGVSASRFTGTMNYITIDTTGNATAFGNVDTTDNWGNNGLACGSNGTRGVFAGVGTDSDNNQIQYITIDTTGNTTDFGQLSLKRDFYSFQKVSDSTRTLMGGGLDLSGGNAGRLNTIDYITTGTTGNSTDFGDLTVGLQGASGTSNGTVGVWTGGFNTSSATINVIQSVTIQTPGNATDFGDLVGNRYEAAASSGSAS
jgi:hypothetical protein